MTDLHTHILPLMDDGSKSVEESLRLLDMEREQGITTVALTPHFYGYRESLPDFLMRRQRAWDQLSSHLPENTPRLLLGAEAAWFPSLGKLEGVERLCLGESRYILLELPFEPWSFRLADQIYDFASATGLTPILAHVERYLPTQGRDKIREIVELGFPMQLNGDSLLSFWGRRRCLPLLQQGDWHLGSDCHNEKGRPPRMGQALTLLSGLDRERLERMTNWSPGEEGIAP